MKFSIAILMNLSFCFAATSISNVQIHSSDIKNDCTKPALNCLSLSDLAETAQKSRKCFRNAGDVFGRRFGAKTILIEGPFSNEAEKSIREFDDDIKIRSFATMSKVLKSFCHKIQTLRIDYKQIGPDQRYSVGMEVNELCSKYLIEFAMINVEANELSAMQKPFQRIEKVSLIGWFEKLENEHLTLDELFPSLRVLELSIDGVYDANSINRTMPYLEHVEISKHPSHSIDFITLFNLSNFLKMNSQIRVLMLQHPIVPMLNVVRDYLPNVKKLKLELSYGENYSAWEENEQIQLKNVEILNVIAISNQALNFMSFNQLKEFELHSFSDMSEWVNYITVNLRKLQKLYLSRGTLNAHHMESLIGQLPHLRELNATFDLDVETETIFKLVNGSKQLKSIHLQISNEIYDELQQRLENNDWTESNKIDETDTLLSSWLSYER
ncbi:uncharacterized protein LOC129577119 isoform X2 [Sitodiplosis mosellana]|nr:uncharacterized protein LOC129577119 isoform X2 [Sitodiplosis mosellana]